MEEARKYQVLPLDDRLSQRLDPSLRESGRPRTAWTYFGNEISLPEAVGPTVYPFSHTIDFDLIVPEQGADGVLASCGGDSGGWTIFVKNGKLNYFYSFFGFETAALESPGTLPAGPVRLHFEFTAQPFNPEYAYGAGGTMRAQINDAPAGEATLTKAAFRHGVEPFEIGRDSISPVSPAYADQGAFPYTGTINKVEFHRQ
jgi:arylsulfatase